MKKSFIIILSFLFMFTLLQPIEDIHATDFNGKEDYYMKLCSSQLSSNQSTCKEFNEYLKKKNKSLKKDISETKSQIDSTNANLDQTAKQIASLNDQIATKEQEIRYLQNSINSLEASIMTKETEVKDRMYAMQSYNNSNSYVDFIFGAENFSDFFSRINSVNEITSYDKDLIIKISDEKKQVEGQKSTMAVAKQNLEGQQKQQVTLQKQYENLYSQQNNLLAKQQQEQKDTAKAQSQLDSYLEALVKETASTSHGITGDSDLGRLIANKALSKQGYMYLWGGCHTMAEVMNPNTTRFDCSGLVSWAYYQAGVNIGTHTTATLVNEGIAITASQLQAGDIILFNNSSGSVCHVGIAINNTQMVHAPQTGQPVQVSNLTSSWRVRVRSYRRLY